MNKLLVVDEHRYYRTPDGRVWIHSQNDYNFWKRYLNVFDKIKVVSRIEEVNAVPNHMLLSSGANVEFAAIINYIGPYQYARNVIKVKKQLKNIFNDCSHAIFRLPSELSFNILPSYLRADKPFGIELVIDPWDALSPNATKSMVRPIVRLRWYRLVKKYCMLANGVSYVTKEALQNRYPCKAQHNNYDKTKYFTTNYSSIEMRKEYLSNPKKFKDQKVYTIIHVGTMHNYIKGQDVLLKAIKKVRDKGYNVKANLVGDGRIKSTFIKLTEDLGLDEHINFTGQLKGSEAVRNYLVQSDLFVFPTKAEGLPRVIIEAMACGLPCISTPVNGTPELLSNEFLLNPTDVDGFAEKIIYFLNNPDKMEIASKNNIRVASDFTSEKLEIKRTEFYNKLLTLDNR